MQNARGGSAMPQQLAQLYYTQPHTTLVAKGRSENNFHAIKCQIFGASVNKTELGILGS